MSRKKSTGKCTLWFCNRRHYARGLCGTHYQNWLRYGTPLPSLSYDLSLALETVEEYRDVAEFVVAEYILFDFREEGFVTMECDVCGEKVRMEESRQVDRVAELKHKDNCVIGKALRLNALTVNGKGEYSYPIGAKNNPQPEMQAQ